MPITNTGEARHAAALVDALLAKGAKISIYDSEEWSLAGSTDRAAILETLGATEMEAVVARDSDGNTLGRFDLIYGNAPDELVSDHTDNAFCEAIWNELAPIRTELEG